MKNEVMRERISGLDNRIKSSPHIKSTSPDDVAQAPQVTNGAGARPSCLLVPLVDALPEKMGESREASLWKSAEDLKNLAACSPFSSCLPGRYGEKKKNKVLPSLSSNQGRTPDVLMTSGNMAEPEKEVGALEG